MIPLPFARSERGKEGAVIVKCDSERFVKGVITDATDVLRENRLIQSKLPRL